jgi:hypothetical protein
MKAFAEPANWFFVDVRCGILHQGEVRNGWRVLRKGPLLDRKEKSINATKVLKAVQDAVHDYSRKLGEESNWTNFKKKMVAIRENCE